MKKLSKILKNQSHRDGFPVMGVDGYGGEQDGDRVRLGMLYVASRKEAKNIMIPSYMRLHRADYSARYGWEVVLGWWSSQEKESDLKKVAGLDIM